MGMQRIIMNWRVATLTSWRTTAAATLGKKSGEREGRFMVNAVGMRRDEVEGGRARKGRRSMRQRRLRHRDDKGSDESSGGGGGAGEYGQEGETGSRAMWNRRREWGVVWNDRTPDADTQKGRQRRRWGAMTGG